MNVKNVLLTFHSNRGQCRDLLFLDLPSIHTLLSLYPDDGMLVTPSFLKSSASSANKDGKMKGNAYRLYIGQKYLSMNI